MTSRSSKHVFVTFHRPKTSDPATGFTKTILMNEVPRTGDSVRINDLLWKIHLVEWTPEHDEHDAYVVLR